jgi:small subunit ribosomal protein S4
MKRMGAKSPYQARQIVSHGHVSIGNRKVNRPGYIVKTEEEAQILLHIEIQAAPAGGEAAPAS